MALEIGTVTANSGMSQSIYEEMDVRLSPPLQRAVDEAEGDAKDAASNALKKARVGWQKLSFAIAKGVVEHLRANLEIKNIRTRGDVTVSISGSTAEVSNHEHGAGSLEGTQTGITFEQFNDGTGLIA